VQTARHKRESFQKVRKWGSQPEIRGCVWKGTALGMKCFPEARAPCRSIWQKGGTWTWGWWTSVGSLTSSAM
jgi:hypothetical protein